MIWVFACCFLRLSPLPFMVFFFFNDTATTEIYTLSLHDALPIFVALGDGVAELKVGQAVTAEGHLVCGHRSEEHTSELQSPCNLVCRLLLEKKKKKKPQHQKQVTAKQAPH